MKYKATILSISVHPDNENPVFGERSTHITVDDEAGGPFLKLIQCNDQITSGEIRVDFGEMEVIYATSKILSSQFDTKENSM
jgi:hypothetical protein